MRKQSNTPPYSEARLYSGVPPHSVLGEVSTVQAVEGEGGYPRLLQISKSHIADKGKEAAPGKHKCSAR